jgi:two-component system, chemotaxis family, chemotaxis protein CheY
MSQGKVLLIVDDDEDCRSSLGEVFESEGCKVYCAENGVHAFEFLAVIRPDLMIVDLMMPAMNGWDFCARLEQDTRLSNIPVVILTAVGRMHSFGQKRVLHKPVTLSTLVALLDIVDTPTKPPPSPTGP